MQYKFTPQIDKESFTISFGMAKNIPLIRKYRSAKSEQDLLCQISDLWDRRLYGKDFYKKYTEVVGLTPSATITLLAKLSWKELLCGFDKKQVYRWCYFGGIVSKPSTNSFKSLMDNTHKVQQALDDNQEHLVPFVLKLGMTPKEIKDSMSRAEWKQIVNNSFTRNKLLAGRMNYRSLLNISSGVLKYWHNHTSPEALACVDSYLKENKAIGALSGRGVKRNIYGKCRTVEDTVNMAVELGEHYNPKWSHNRWIAEHDRMRKLYECKDFTDVEIKRGNYRKLPRQLVDKGYTATLLFTPMQVAEEGKNMGHCVASYARRCQNGIYIVYSITSPTGTKSTLGLHGNGVLEQHKLKYNQRPDEDTTKFGEWVSEQLLKIK